MNKTVIMCIAVYVSVQVFIIYLLRERKRMTPHERYTKRLQWFKSRIGKRVYRTPSCSCPVCKTVEIRGLIIQDNLHATYLRDCEADLELHYADSKIGVWWWLVKRFLKRIINKL